MNAKRFVLVAILTLAAGNGFADVAPDTVPKEVGRFPASLHQQQLIRGKPAKVGEFARFEATVERGSEKTYRELPASPNQLQVLGKTPDKARP
jgi:hypothetical protein